MAKKKEKELLMMMMLMLMLLMLVMTMTGKKLVAVEYSDRKKKSIPPLPSL